MRKGGGEEDAFLSPFESFCSRMAEKERGTERKRERTRTKTAMEFRPNREESSGVIFLII